MTLTEQIAQAEQVTPDVLEKFLKTAQLRVFEYQFRIKASEAVKDTELAERFKREMEPYAKQQAYFEKQIAEQFPEYKITELNIQPLEDNIVLDIYYQSVELKRDAKIKSDAAKALGLDDEGKAALEDTQRALRYITFIKPYADKLNARAAKLNPHGDKLNGHKNGKGPR